MPQDSDAPRRTSSGFEIDVTYGPDRPITWRPEEALGDPGEYSFTRGPYPTMYRGRLWTIRQYAGFGSAEATNERFRALLDAGQTGLSVAFDLPPQLGLDPDDPLAAGEVGKVGVAAGSGNLLYPMKVALERGATVGEVSAALVGVFGRYRPRT